MKLKEIGWDAVDGIDPSQVKDQFKAFVTVVINFRVAYIFGKFLSICRTGYFSTMDNFHAVSCAFSPSYSY
jgi:hypothetical protein